jgi:hypothetical protein
MTGNVGLVEAALASRYQFEGELGAGEIATVYLAHDVKHDRNGGDQRPPVFGIVTIDVTRPTDAHARPRA